MLRTVSFALLPPYVRTGDFLCVAQRASLPDRYTVFLYHAYPGIPCFVACCLFFTFFPIHFVKNTRPSPRLRLSDKEMLSLFFRRFGKSLSGFYR
jgi:hypothetical protein